ncbi:hypothetical protein [Streptomyces sp. AC512_CC834]|uniref:hypothetical protein n=1 Tax=Streptomyces sp. AC512_CC834 TaxID=2823691 RepID=UPI001C259064|nr:hypothetical protein [Streptomyces sp. AC512_CC834]
MGDLKKLLELVEGMTAWDVYVPGFLDRDNGIPKFMPLSDRVYIALEDGYLSMESVAGGGQLALHRVLEPVAPAALDGEDEEFTLCSYGQLFLQGTPTPLPFTRIRAVVNSDSDSQRAVFRCVEFTFGGSFVLFADPAYYFGVHLEGVGAYERWLRSDPAVSESSGPIRELTWVR